MQFSHRRSNMRGEAVLNFVLNVDYIIWLSDPLKIDKFLHSYYQQISESVISKEFLKKQIKKDLDSTR